MKLERGIIADVAAAPPTPTLKKMCSQELEELAETMKERQRGIKRQKSQSQVMFFHWHE